MKNDCSMPSAEPKIVPDDALREPAQVGGEAGNDNAFDEYLPTGVGLSDSDDIGSRNMLGEGEIEEDAYTEGRSVGKYNIIRTIGSGSSSKVYLAYDTETEERVSIKIVKRRAGEPNGDEADKRIYREVVISTLLNHPNIVRLLDFVYTRMHFFLVFEYVKGVQLYDAVLKNSYIPESGARRYFRQIISAVDYVHRNCIVHRDLKIENILIDQNDNVKIIDFGLSNFYDNKVLLNTFCGSLYFAAPELLLGQRYNGPEIDVWSLGVVLYVMLCGRVPFDDESVYALQGKIKSARFSFLRPLSSEAQDLILGMLHAGTGRFGIEEVKKSKWLNMSCDNVVHNYMIARLPITKIVPECLRALKAALSFQFENVEVELQSFADLCGEKFDSLEGIYWTKRPVVSLYYLLIEDYSAGSSISKREWRGGGKEGSNYGVVISDGDNMAAILHNFVRFVFSGGHNELYRRYFIKNIFKHSPSQVVRPEPSIVWPIIRRSYTKGFFQGIKVRHIGSSNALKKIILDVFLQNDIIYEASEKSYFCSYFDCDDECYFKVSMYYNVILGEYYINLSLLNSKKHCFRVISSIVTNALKERTGRAVLGSEPARCCTQMASQAEK